MKGMYKGATAKPSQGKTHCPRYTKPGTPQTGASRPAKVKSGPRTP